MATYVGMLNSLSGNYSNAAFSTKMLSVTQTHISSFKAFALFLLSETSDEISEARQNM